MPQCQSRFIHRCALESFHLFGVMILCNHLPPRDVDNARENVRVELSVFDMAEVLGQSFTRQCLGLSLLSFVPTDPPTFNIKGG